MLNIPQVINGTIKNVLNQNDDLYQERIKVCKECKLIKTDKIFGEVCNPSLYINPETNEASKTPKLGFLNGCGCILRSKCRVVEAKCPLNRW